MSSLEVMDWFGLNQSAPRVKFAIPPAKLLQFPPSPDPMTVPPPARPLDIMQPFTISPEIFNNALRLEIPLTVVLIYISTVKLIDGINARREGKPWALSKTGLFKAFVILHNVALAVYSAWTFIGIVNMLRMSLPHWQEESLLLRTADSLCKIHGPGGLGNATTFDTRNNTWTTSGSLLQGPTEVSGPSRSDSGRLWNEGLAYYGWLFYLSKIYEVLDTYIILAKGKQSSLLGTYHHAGTLLAMWVTIRYMSSPIWMTIIWNSGIHTMMYTFYLVTALGFRVPRWLKQSLTTLQITQFFVVTTWGFLHVFVSYQLPVQVPYLHYLEGLPSKEIRYPNELQWVSCLDTSGQATGVLSACAFMVPLTLLFIQFFITSYSNKAGKTIDGKVALPRKVFR